MIKELPDKWVRKAVFDAINNIVVDGVTIPCYDTYVTDEINVDAYVLMTTQTNNVSKVNKCSNQWESSILLDVVTIYRNSGNTGSRLFADNILNRVKDLTDESVFTLDVSSGLTIVKNTQVFPNDISSSTQNENVFRKLMRIELYID